MEPILRLRNISKTFPGQRALNGVDLDLEAGQVHALLGQNGSGKSTLIKVLAGFHQPDAGATAWLRDEPFTLGSATAVERAGVRFIHQDLGLIAELTAIDNLALGRGYHSRVWVNRREEARAARRLLEEFGLDLDVNTPVGELSAVERSMLTIARAIRVDEGESPVRLLVLDEPTAALAGSEVDRLFGAIRNVVASGAAVLYVTHRLDEVFRLADAVTVLRDGEVIVTRSAKGLDHQTLVSLIVGRRLKQMEESHIPHRQEETVLEALAVSGRLVEDVSFVLNRGEVLGLAGLAGSGREELPYLIGGAAQLDSGSLCLDGETLGRLTPRAALGAGLVLVGADRQRQSAIPALMVRENLCLPRLETHGPLRWVGIRRERRTSMQWIERLEVRPREPDRMLATYSGGNQQKVVLARALRLQPRVLILDEPAQGIDVGAKVALFTHLSEVAASGLPILVASSDPEDLATVCDRVLVLRGGRVGAELDGENLTTDRIVEETLGPVPTEA